MSEITTTKNFYHDESDEDADTPSTKHLHQSDDESDEELSIDTKQNNKNDASKTGKVKGTKTFYKKTDKKVISKKPSVQLASVNVSASGAIRMIDTFDRPGDATAEGLYAQNGAYAVSPENEPGQRIPKAGYIAEAGVGRARAEYSVFQAEAKGPSASFGAEASVIGVGAIARAEIASASASAGPLGVKVGLGLDTGASVGLDGVELKFLGTGISIGPKTSVSVLGSEVSCSVM